MLPITLITLNKPARHGHQSPASECTATFFLGIGEIRRCFLELDRNTLPWLRSLPEGGYDFESCTPESLKTAADFFDLGGGSRPALRRRTCWAGRCLCSTGPHGICLRPRVDDEGTAFLTGHPKDQNCGAAYARFCSDRRFHNLVHSVGIPQSKLTALAGRGRNAALRHHLRNRILHHRRILPHPTARPLPNGR